MEKIRIRYIFCGFVYNCKYTGTYINKNIYKHLVVVNIPLDLAELFVGLINT